MTATPIFAFLMTVCATLFLCVMFSSYGDELSEFYTARSSLTPLRNALAMCGDYVSVLILLVATGSVALTGYDGLTLAVGSATAMGVLLVLAQPLRNIGRFTLGDTFRARFPGRAARIAGAVVTLSYCLPLAMVQLSAAGRATSVLVGLDGSGAGQVCTVLIGVIMICAAAMGGMRGISLLQVVKTVLLLCTLVVLVLALLNHLGWNLSALLNGAAYGSGHPNAYYTPGLLQGTSSTGRFEQLSLLVTVILGAAVAPHLLMRLNTSRSGAAARRSATGALGLVVVLHVMAVVLGLGAAALVGAHAVAAADPSGSSALLLLAVQLDSGGLLQAAVVSAVFITSLSVVAALLLAAASSLVHDVLAHTSRDGHMAAPTEIKAVRWTTIVIGCATLALATICYNWSVAFLAHVVAAVGASAILPALVYELFWKGYTRTGLLWTIYGGLGCCLLLQFFGPAVSGAPAALFPHSDFAWFPLHTTGLVSVPVGFLLGWAGSTLSTRRGAAHVPYAELETRALNGAST
ncbi:cation acetate symporter [Streptomyces sp. So13.3]|uniref:sodium:solute symporter family transporter n=1 Tax=Streptomyces TaxID=1883 RepID=UPI001105DE7A|nr:MULTISPECIES: cation acetate symporter [unclassified Streptomyces]MCZ4098707.1 cation acetate symporter [Streptomyces sp. H39-C1]QNA76269.1 cation acetate symporter [Streptomyces sp. So13.3]